METSNIFENISEHIIQHIKSAENSIQICVPWLTDEDILVELIEKSKQKVHIEIITLNNEINRTKTFYFNKLISNGSKVYLIDKTADGGIPHLKFCVIDDETLITGSYNWSHNAKRNDENILIKVINDFEDYEIINDYNLQFINLQDKYGIRNKHDDWANVNRYTNEAKRKQDEAMQYYEIAFDYLENDKYSEALEFLDEGIKILPYPDKSYFWLKHIILTEMKKYLECTENLYKYFWEIADNDFEEIEQFKKTYKRFVNFIISNGVDTYKIIETINQKTKAKLGKFALLDVEPYFFKYEELDIHSF